MINNIRRLSITKIMLIQNYYTHTTNSDYVNMIFDNYMESHYYAKSIKGW